MGSVNKRLLREQDIIQASDLSNTFAEAIAGVFQRARRSLVVVHNGRQGSGAGVVWRQGGIVVTNYHVIHRGRPRISLVEDASSAGDRGYPTRVIAAAPEIDLAILQVDLPHTHGRDIPMAPIADARNLRVGQIALAIGHPWGQVGAVSIGVITSLGKVRVAPRPRSRLTFLKGSDIDVIRSDVRLAPGNSGGPLMNAAGGVIGINTMIIGGDLGIAIPSHVVNAFVEEVLIEGSSVMAMG